MTSDPIVDLGPCDSSGARNVVIKVPDKGPPPTPPGGVITAEAVLEANGIQDLAENVHDIVLAAVGNNLKFNLRIELGGETAPSSEVVNAINALLAEVSEDLRFYH